MRRVPHTFRARSQKAVGRRAPALPAWRQGLSNGGPTGDLYSTQERSARLFGQRPKPLLDLPLTRERGLRNKRGTPLRAPISLKSGGPQGDSSALAKRGLPKPQEER